MRLPDIVYRVALRGNGLAYSHIRPEDDADSKAGHRFDVVGTGVLYAATNLRACYLETLGVLRPSPAVNLVEADDDDDFLPPGVIPPQWVEDRSIYGLSTVGETSMVFLDLVDLETRTTLGEFLRKSLREIGVHYLDVPEVASKNRGLTRLLSRTIYSLRDDNGQFAYGGIRYTSRYDVKEECWAIFKRYPLEIVMQNQISFQDPTLRRVTEELGLTIPW